MKAASVKDKLNPEISIKKLKKKNKKLVNLQSQVIVHAVNSGEKSSLQVIPVKKNKLAKKPNKLSSESIGKVSKKKKNARQRRNARRLNKNIEGVKKPKVKKQTKKLLIKSASPSSDIKCSSQIKASLINKNKKLLPQKQQKDVRVEKGDKSNQVNVENGLTVQVKKKKLKKKKKPVSDDTLNLKAGNTETHDASAQTIRSNNEENKIPKPRLSEERFKNNKRWKRKKKKKPTTLVENGDETVQTVSGPMSYKQYKQRALLERDRIFKERELRELKKKETKLSEDDSSRSSIKRKNESCDDSVPTSSKKKKKKKLSTEIKEKPDIWFDDVDPILLEGHNGTGAKSGEEVPSKEADNLHEPELDSQGSTKELVKQNSYEGLTKVIAMDCEMVGIGFEGHDSILARISIVNHFGQVLYDKFVKPTEKVTDYRTQVSGIRPSDLLEGISFSVVQKEVSDLLLGRILVGHALRNDLKCLYLSHSKRMCRDTSKFKPFKRLFGGRTPSLRKLTEKLLSMKIQHGEHSSIQDAQAAMRIYTLHRKQWEDMLRNKTEKGVKTIKPNADTPSDDKEPKHTNDNDKISE